MHPRSQLSHVVALARATIPPMHRAGRPIVTAVGAAALAMRALTGRGGVAGLLATAGVAAFFREPRRVTPRRAGIVVAPADGTVSAVTDASPPSELGLAAPPGPRVSVFLSIFDVHVQRIPVDATVVRIAYRPGTFVSADLEAASDANQRNSVHLRSTEGHDLAVVQIAGQVARRIVCGLSEGAEVAAGETYGLIRFGSRVDTYLPAGSQVLVELGQRTVGGETVLGQLPPAAGG